MFISFGFEVDPKICSAIPQSVCVCLWSTSLLELSPPVLSSSWLGSLIFSKRQECLSKAFISSPTLLAFALGKFIVYVGNLCNKHPVSQFLDLHIDDDFLFHSDLAIHFRSDTLDLSLPRQNHLEVTYSNMFFNRYFLSFLLPLQQYFVKTYSPWTSSSPPLFSSQFTYISWLFQPLYCKYP